MILTITCLSLAALSGAGAKFYYPKYAKFRDRNLIRQEYSSKILLDDTEWKGFKQTLKESKGNLYSDALIVELLNQGYRFSCKQIYELRDMYRAYDYNKNLTGHVYRLTHYDLAVKIDAEEKIFSLLHEPKKILLTS